MNSVVYIIVLNWNGTEDTIACLSSIKNIDYNNYVVVLVDNGSRNEELEILQKWCHDNFNLLVLYNIELALNGGNNTSEVELKKTVSNEKLIFIKNNENLGFAAGNNVALKYVLAKEAKYAMLLNNDTILEKESISILMNFLAAHDEYVAVTPQIRYFEPNDVIWNCGGKITWFGNRRYYYAGDHISKVPLEGFRNVSFITGCAILFKPKMTGILTEKFFFGEEDLDFSFRQKMEKKKMACCFSSIIYHKVNASVKKLDVNILGSVYIQYLSRLINNRQYSSKFMFIVKIAVNLGYAIPMIMLRYKISLKRIFFMIIKILMELRKIDKIDKDYSLRFLKEDFSHFI